jgi:hypothetical protein
MVLIPCVGGYFLLTGLLAYISSRIVKDKIAETKCHPGNPGIELHSKMPRYGDQYVLKACMKDKESGIVKESVRKEYIGTLYDEDGEVQVKTLSAAVNDLLHALDTPSESSNGDSKKDQ